MKPFAYARPKYESEVLSLLTATARPKGGGVDLIDLAKNGVSTPETLVDLGGLEDPGFHGLKVIGTDIVLGGGVTLSVIAEGVTKVGPLLAEAALAAATPQIRNVATLAGSLLQRPRCTYFRDPFFDCLKRGGRSCPSMEGEHAEGAIFGNGKCCAVHPSNMAVALLAAGARVHLSGGPDEKGVGRQRELPIADFYIAPEEDPLREARIEAGEILTRVLVPRWPSAAYVEIDQKQSFDWASASAAVALQMEGGKVKEARVALGAVAPVPLLSEAAVAALVGKVPDERAAEAAAEAAVKGATPLRDNGHKVQHLRVCVKRAVLKAASRAK